MNEKELMLEEMKKHKQNMQLKFTTDLLDRIEHYSEKAIKKDYMLSTEERLQFEKMLRVLNGMAKWF